MNNILSQKQNSAVIIFAKYPEPGRVKTRLASETDDYFASQFYKICAEHIFQEIHKVKIQGFLFLPISDDVNLVEHWAGKDFIYKQQIGKSLGDKMGNAFNEIFNSGFHNIIVIGTDVPDITTEVIESAFYHLKSTDVVISPSDDGGYSLLGMNKKIPLLFENIQWSTDKVLPDTILKMEKHNIDFTMLPALQDIDTLDDLKTYLQNKNSVCENPSVKQVKNEILKVTAKMSIET